LARYDAAMTMLPPVTDFTTAAATMPGRPRVGWRVALLSIAGFWLLYFVLNTVRAWIGDEPEQLWMLGRRAVVTLGGVGLTLLLCLALRAVERRAMRVVIATAFIASAPIAVAYAALNYLVFYLIEPNDVITQMMATYPDQEHLTPLVIIGTQALTWYFFIVAWSVLYIALSYATGVQHAERQAAQFRGEAQTAQLRALRYQINPHFLFNTLNSLSSLILRGRGDEADRMVMNLSTFFRTSLADEPTADVPLAEEVRLQKLYLDIERVRFPTRLLVETQIPPELEAAPVPGMILQPLVENAIKYGVSPTTRPVTITITALAAHGRLHLIVEDDGDGAGGGAGHGVGLRNIRDRLAARYGAAAECHWGPRRGGGWRAELALPLDLR
jgi:signal transduction histidine kinase